MDKSIIVIGGGPGGYVAAIRAAQLGAKVTLVEKDSLGGTCLNRGCIPTKTLYRNAEILNTLKNIDEFGISIGEYKVDIEKFHNRKNEVVNQLVGGVSQLLKANGVNVIYGAAKLQDNNTVLVILNDGSEAALNADNIIIATGSRPATPTIEGADLEGIYTSEDMLNFKSIPKSLAIIGGGVIGMEFANIFNAMGSKVSVIEFMQSILAQVDSDLTKRLTPSLKKKGIDIYTSTKVNKINKENDTFTVYAEGKKGEVKIEAESVLISVGRTPNTENLNLDGVGINFSRKGIEVDDNFETNIKGVYAIGDVNGKIMLAHAASHQGISVVNRIMYRDNHVDNEIVPNCIFIVPEISSVGITEQTAKERGISYKTSKFLFGANGKALALGEPEGLVKVISNEAGKLLGVHIMGPHASDLVHEGVLAISNGLTVEDIEKTIHGHPTLAEAFAEAVSGLKGEAIHMMPSKL